MSNFDLLVNGFIIYCLSVIIMPIIIFITHLVYKYNRPFEYSHFRHDLGDIWKITAVVFVPVLNTICIVTGTMGLLLTLSLGKAPRF